MIYTVREVCYWEEGSTLNCKQCVWQVVQKWSVATVLGSQTSRVVTGLRKNVKGIPRGRHCSLSVAILGRPTTVMSRVLATHNIPLRPSALLLRCCTRLIHEVWRGIAPWGVARGKIIYRELPSDDYRSIDRGDCVLSLSALASSSSSPLHFTTTYEYYTYCITV